MSGQLRSRARRIGAASLMVPTLLIAGCAETDAPPEWDTTRYAPQNRPDVRGTMGAVSSDHPLATQAGLAVLREDGDRRDHRHGRDPRGDATAHERRRW